MHGHIAQKSYGKEKRFLCPPPVVRMTGNVSDTIETSVFRLVNADVGEDIPVISNTQGIRLNAPNRNIDARAHLREGISFPGLYASRTGKAKGLRLRLDAFQPGGTLPREAVNPTSMESIENLFAANQPSAEPKESESVFDIEGLASASTIQTGPGNDMMTLGSESYEQGNSIRESAQTDLPEAKRSRGDNEEGNSHMHMPEAGVVEGESEHASYKIETPTGEEHSNEADAIRNGAPANVTSLVQDFNRFQITDRPWATFEVSGIQIVSKPSKQTVGTTKPSKNSRAIGIRVGDPFALWSRVSAQTVMTRYLYVDVDRELLVGRNGDWSAWVMDVIKRGEPPQGHGRDFIPDSQVLTYGSIVILRDVHTQFRTEPLLLCKVINGTVYHHDYGPVSELHRLAFAKSVPGQGRWYLRSPMIERVRDKRGSRPGSSFKSKSKPTTEKPDERSPEPTQGMASEEGDFANGDVGADAQDLYLPEASDVTLEAARTHQQQGMRSVPTEASDKVNFSPTLFSAPQIKLEQTSLGLEEREHLDDYLTWTISGISEFCRAFNAVGQPLCSFSSFLCWIAEHNFTFFEGRHEIGDYSSVFKSPLTPMPAILEAPTYNHRDNTITFTVTNYFYDDDNIAFRNKPLFLYLGAIGPLRVRTFHSIAPDDNWSVADREPHRFPAIVTDGSEGGPPESRPYSSVPQNLEHTVLVIDCPDPIDMWSATQIERDRYQRNEQIEMLSHTTMAAEDGMDDTVHDPELPPYVKPGQDKKRRRKTDGDDGAISLDVNGTTSGQLQTNAGTDEGLTNHPTPFDMDEDATEELKKQPALNSSGHSNREPDQHDPRTHKSSPSVTIEQTELPHPFQQVNFDSHDLQHPRFESGDDHDQSTEHPDTEITREMVESLVRQAQLQEQGGDLGSYNHNGLGSFSEGFNLDDQQQMALLAAQAARSQVDSILHNDMAFVHGVTNDIGIFTARALEAAAHAAQAGNDVLDPQSILAQHQAGLADQPSNQTEDSSAATRNNLDLNQLTGISLEVGETSQRFANQDDGQSVTKSKKRKMPSNESKHTARKEKQPKGGPKKPRTVPPPPTLVQSPLHSLEPPAVKITKRPFSGSFQAQGHIPKIKQLGASSLPLLFLRQSDNTGYHTGKNLVVNRSDVGGSLHWGKFSLSL